MSFYDKVRNQKFLSFTMIVFTLAVGIVMGTLVQTGVKAAREQSAAPDATPLVIPPRAELQSTFAKIAKQLEPSVVNISVEFGSRTRANSPSVRANPRRMQPDNGDNGDDSGGNSGNTPDDLFRRFFGFGGGGGIQINPNGMEPSRALGSGVVVDKNGYILTNNHVVDKASKITVKFTGDETEYPAQRNRHRFGDRSGGYQDRQAQSDPGQNR